MPQPGEKLYERRESLNLYNKLIDNSGQEKLQEMERAKILSGISSLLGDREDSQEMAEQIFRKFRHHITKYVIHHEYGKENSVQTRTLVWLDSKTNPESVEKIHAFGEMFLK